MFSRLFDMEKLRMIAMVLLSLTAVAAQNLETFTALYGPFDSSYKGILDLDNSAATISNGALQLTPNLAYEKGLLGMPLENQYGRAVLNQIFKLSEQSYNKNSDRVFSFNSSFLFNVHPLGRHTTPGEGLAFFMTSNGRFRKYLDWRWRSFCSCKLPKDCFGQYLGLTNLEIDGNQYNDLVAVEFDSFKQPNLKSQKHSPSKKTLLVVGIGVLLLVIGVTMMAYCLRCKKRSMVPFKSNVLRGALKRLPGTPREFQFKDLKKATNNFDENKKLGQGGFGVVYKGHLQNENLEVAVKWFSRETIKGQNDFLAELTIINCLRHKHVVRLLGWCHNKGKLLLVYDYMPNGSLDAHLFTRTLDSRPLRWDQRYNIISGVASALNYLHNEYDQRVVHRDLKASNIMLDSDFNAKLGDFGLARALDKEKSSYIEAGGVAGTPGYIAPECFLTGKATQDSDVYAFGVVLLEIVCGLRPRTKIDEFHFLVDWVWFLHREGRILDAIEDRLRDEYVVEEAQRILILALACSNPIASERPKTQAIVHIISGFIPVPYVPPFKPAFICPSMRLVERDDISSLDSMTESTKSFPTTHLGLGFMPECVTHEPHADDKSQNCIVSFVN